MYRGKVVVVGASAPARRDRHYTPLGDMAGAEVTVNAMRSFFLYPSNRDKTFGELLWAKCVIVVFCAFPWLCYHFVSARRQDGPRPVSRVQLVLSGARSAALWALTMGIAVIMSMFLSFHVDGPAPSMDILLPVFAIALESYAHLAHRLHDLVHAPLQQWFGGGA